MAEEIQIDGVTLYGAGDNAPVITHETFPEVSLEGIRVNEDGTFTMPNADGSGETTVTPDELTKGMVRFGRDMSVTQLLDNAGGNLREPTVRGILEFLDKRAEHRSFVETSSTISYTYEHYEKRRKITGADANKQPIYEMVEVLIPVSMTLQNGSGPVDLNEDQTKFIKRLANFIENEITLSTNESIHGFEIVKTSDTGLFTIKVRRTPVSTYSFVWRLPQ